MESKQERKKRLKREWDQKNLEHKREYERNALRTKQHLREYRKQYLKEYTLQKYFGISLAQYQELLNKQDNACFICRKDQSEFDKYLAVDHNHTTGEIRGLLCYECNRNLIRNHEDAKLFERAALYLSRATGLFVPEKYKRGKWQPT